MDASPDAILGSDAGAEPLPGLEVRTSTLQSLLERRQIPTPGSSRARDHVHRVEPRVTRRQSRQEASSSVLGPDTARDLLEDHGQTPKRRRKIESCHSDRPKVSPDLA